MTTSDELTLEERRDDARRSYDVAIGEMRRRAVIDAFDQSSGRYVFIAAPALAPCLHFRNAVTHETCGAGIRYSDIAGTERNSVGEVALRQSRLPCWWGEVGGREACPFRETE